MHRSHSQSEKRTSSSAANRKRNRDDQTAEEKMNHQPNSAEDLKQTRNVVAGDGVTRHAQEQASYDDDSGEDGSGGDEDDEYSEHDDVSSGNEFKTNDSKNDDARQQDADENDMFKKFRREKRLAMNRASARARRKKKKVMLETLSKQVTELTKKNQSLQETNEKLVRKVETMEASLNQAKETINSLLGQTQTRLADKSSTLPAWYQGLLRNSDAQTAGLGMGATTAATTAAANSLLLGTPGIAAANRMSLLNAGSGVGMANAASLVSDPFYAAALQQTRAQMLSLTGGAGQSQQQMLDGSGGGLSGRGGLPAALSANLMPGEALSSLLLRSSSQVPPGELVNSRNGDLSSTLLYQQALAAQQAATISANQATTSGVANSDPPLGGYSRSSTPRETQPKHSAEKKKGGENFKNHKAKS